MTSLSKKFIFQGTSKGICGILRKFSIKVGMKPPANILSRTSKLKDKTDISNQSNIAHFNRYFDEDSALSSSKYLLKCRVYHRNVPHFEH